MMLNLVFFTANTPSPNVSTIKLRQWGFRQCLPFSQKTLRGKHYWHPIAVMGVVDTFGRSPQITGFPLTQFIFSQSSAKVCTTKLLSEAKSQNAICTVPHHLMNIHQRNIIYCLQSPLWILITQASTYVSTQKHKQYMMFKQSNAISNRTLAPFLACLRVLEKHNILFAASISNMVNIVQGGLASGLFLL